MIVTKTLEGTFKLFGRIDANNAEQFKKELLAAVENKTEIIFDFDELEYISSTGLRVFLALRKRFKGNITAINASRDVYEIFAVTGFNDMINISKKLRQIDISNCEILGSGANGEVYRIDDENVVKVFNSNVSMEVVKAERDYSRAAFVAGIPTAISYDVVKCGDSYGAVYELLNAKTLSEAITLDPSKTSEYGQQMGALLKKLHNTNADTAILKDLNKEYIDRAENMHKYLEDKEVDKILDVYNRLSERKTLLHGDFHCKNIMISGKELLFIDMGDVGYGNPWLDFGSSHLALINVGLKNPAASLQYIGITYEQCKVVWDNIFKVYFETDDFDKYMKVAKIYGDAKYTLTPITYTKANDEIIKKMINSMRVNGLLNPEYDLSALEYVDMI